jgi:hypothetical protein
MALVNGMYPSAIIISFYVCGDIICLINLCEINIWLKLSASIQTENVKLGICNESLCQPMRPAA